jgi:hypothetical protein
MAKKDAVAEVVDTPKGKSNTELGAGIVSRWSRLEADRNYWMSMWQQIAELVMPRKSYILATTITPNSEREARLYDSTGVRANQILAAGCMSYITPADSRWCSFTAPEAIEDGDGVQEYFAEVTEIVMETLARSNFHQAIHELYLDRGCFGTAVLFVEPGENLPITFTNVDVGTFCISDNYEGYVDTMFRRMEMTARQIVQQFGIENVSDGVRNCYNQDNGKGMDEKFHVIHAVYPRDEGSRDKKKYDGPNKPIASCYVEEKGRHILRESGYDELPFMATRYLKWQKSPYGWSPSWTAMPDLRQLNFLQKQMDALAELAAFPRILVPDSMESSLDLRAGGVTYFNASDPNAVPREWMTQGRYDIGLERVAQKQNDINEAFSVPLFQMFTQQENGAPNRMTATEVNARNAERLALFSPTFSRLTTELLTPLLQRVYGILARNGAFPPPPEALIQQGPAGDLFIPEPKVEFNSRIALAVKNMEQGAVDSAVQRAGAVVQMTQDPSVLDNFDFDRMVREGALAAGVDSEYIRPKDQVAQMRQQRAQAQQQQAEMQAQAHAADVAQKVGGIRQDSALAQGVQNQMGAMM